MLLRLFVIMLVIFEATNIFIQKVYEKLILEMFLGVSRFRRPKIFF